MDVKELQKRRAKLVADARAINDKADAENRPKTPEERTQFDGLVAEAERLGEEIASRQRLDALQAVTSAAGNREGEPIPAGERLPHQEPRNLGRYSLLRAIRMMADRVKLDGLEGETSQALLERRRGITDRPLQSNAFIMPYDLPIDLRSAAIGRTRYGPQATRAFDTTAGVGGIPTILDTTYIDILRNRMVVRMAGARIMTDMQGLFAIPRQSAASTMYWLSQGGAPTTSQPTVDQVPFTPRTAGAYTDITRRLAEQINTDAEMFVRDDLANVVARGVDLAAIAGTGLTNQPTGILSYPGISTTPLGTNGGDPTWIGVIAQETAVSTANADMGSLAYVTNAKARGKMKATLKAGSTNAQYIWNADAPDTPLNGYPAFVSNQVPANLVKGTSGAVCSAMIFGNWNDLILAFWSGQDVIVDPFSNSTSGTLRIVTLQDVDINLRHPESFNNILDMTTV
jgi:HK97 family phage major capsid protein